MLPAPSVSRVLVALLVLRVLASPIAARPDSPRPPSNDRFIVRLCAWPAQRVQRFNSKEVLSPRTPGDLRPYRTPMEPASTLDRLARAHLTRLSLLAAANKHLIHLFDAPRC
jgi:hypothetical protein